MEVVKKYIDRFKEDRVVVIGGAAASVWIRHYLGLDIVVEDIDIHVNTCKSNETIVDRWLSYLHGYDEVPPISSITRLTCNSKISYDIFINERDYIPAEIVDGVFVENLDEMILTHAFEIDAMRQDLSYSRTKDKEREDILNKIERMKHRLSLLRNVNKVRNESK